MLKIKEELDLELISDKRCKTNTVNTLGKKYLAECITSKDNTKDLIKIMAKYYPRSGYTDGETRTKSYLRNDLVNIKVYPIIKAFEMFRV